MDKQTTKPNDNRGSNSSDRNARRAGEIKEEKIISDDSIENEEEVMERWKTFFEGGVLISFHSLLPQFNENGVLSITEGEQTICNITPDLFEGRPEIPLKDSRTANKNPSDDSSKRKRGSKSGKDNKRVTTDDNTRE